MHCVSSVSGTDTGKSCTSLTAWFKQSAIVSFHLPQVQSNHADAVILIELRISGVLWVVNLRVDPFAFVGRIVDLPGLPLTLQHTNTGSHMSKLSKG